MGKFVDLTGIRNGRLTVLKTTKKRTISGGVIWECRCDCGTVKNVASLQLKPHRTVSCGCRKKEHLISMITTHKMSQTYIYHCWENMVRRGTGKTHQKYYKDRGIGIANKWLKFENFYKDIGDPPTVRHTIDRINNDRGYSKLNCRWATRKEQSANRRISKNAYR